MSRIGKKPVAIPAGVTASMDDGTLSVKGPKGELSLQMASEVTYTLEEGAVNLAPVNATTKSALLLGYATYIGAKSD